MIFRRTGGWKVRSASAAVGLRRNRIGGLPSHDDPAFALCGAALQHRHQPVVGHPPPRLGNAGVAQERALADCRLGDVNPSAAQFVGRHHGVVGQERAVLDDGELRGQQCRRDLGAAADLRAQQRAATRGVSRLAYSGKR